jgi:hypothetical protein
MMRMLQQVDKANGYVFGDLEERNIQTLLSCAVGAEFEYDKIKDIREKYMDTDSVYSIKHYMIKFVSDLRQVIGFLWFPPQIKLTVTI